MFPLAAHSAYSRLVVGRAALVAVAVTSVMLVAAGPAVAQEDALPKITELNKQAVQEYQAGKPDDARKLLKQALELCGSSGLDKHPIKARTHIHMGIVALMGLNNRDLGIIQFKKALELQPDIKLTKSLITPEVEKAFEDAKSQVSGAGAGDSGGASGGESGGESGGAADAGTGDKAGSDGSSGGAAGTGSTDSAAQESESSPLKHTPVTTGSKGQTINVTVQAESGLDVERVVLAYRPEGATEFKGREMRKSGDAYVAQIPDTATRGGLVSYYIEAQNKDGQAVANRGSVADPYLVKLEGDLESDECTGADCEEEEEKPSRVFISLTLGTGVGMASGHGDMDVDTTIKNGFGMAKLGHIAPEFGFFLGEQWVLSVQLRLQRVSGTTGYRVADTSCGEDHYCEAGNGAFAAFGRLTRIFGEGRVKPFVSLLAGGGYIRHVGAFSGKKDCGKNGNEECVDSVSGGPVLVGGSAGLMLHLTDKLAFMLRLDIQGGFSKNTVNFDGNAGFALRL